MSASVCAQWLSQSKFLKNYTMKKILSTYSLLLLLMGLIACEGGRESQLEGKWQLSSYTDNQQRNMQEQLDFQQSIAGLRIDLELFADGNFERVMMQPGSQVPIKNVGEWYLENEDKILTMKVEKSPLSKLLIVELADDKLVLQVEEEGISTTLTFKR